MPTAVSVTSNKPNGQPPSKPEMYDQRALTASPPKSGTVGVSIENVEWISYLMVILSSVLLQFC